MSIDSNQYVKFFVSFNSCDKWFVFVRDLLLNKNVVRVFANRDSLTVSYSVKRF